MEFVTDTLRRLGERLGPPDDKRREFDDEIIQVVVDNDLKTLQQLVRDGYDVQDVRTEDYRTLVHVATYEGHLEALTLLLGDPGLLKKIDAKDRNKRTPLHLAAAMGYYDCARRLVETGAKLDPQDEEGRTPLHLALQFEWPHVARTLLDLGANTLIEDFQGYNATEIAMMAKDPDVQELLQSCGEPRRSPGGLFSRCFSNRRHRETPLPEHCPNEADGEDARAGSERPLAAAVAKQRSRLYDHDRDPGKSQASAAPLGAGVKDLLSADQVDLDGSAFVKDAAEREPPPPPPRGSSGDSDEYHALYGGSGQRSPHQENLSSAIAQAARAKARRLRHGPGAESESEESDYCEEDHHDAEPDTQEGDMMWFRLRVHFAESVRKLGFEVAWKDGLPVVGSIVPGSEAQQRGLVIGDEIEEISGTKTLHKGRDRLLPKLKARPLTLQVNRLTVAHDAYWQPHIELNLRLGGDGEGLRIECSGQMPVVTDVRPHSAAWNAGFLEGDAIVCANERAVLESNPREMMLAVEERPLVASVWRRPLDADLSQPWSLGELHSGDESYE